MVQFLPCSMSPASAVLITSPATSLPPTLTLETTKIFSTGKIFSWEKYLVEKNTQRHWNGRVLNVDKSNLKLCAQCTWWKYIYTKSTKNISTKNLQKIYKKYKQFRAAVASRPASLEPAHTRALTMYDHFPGANILPEFVKKIGVFSKK